MALKNVITTINADIKKSKAFMDNVQVVKNDSIRFVINMLDGGNPLTSGQMDKIKTATLVNLRPDRVPVTLLGEIVGGNQIVFDVTRSTTDVLGKVRAMVQLYDEQNNRISSLSFSYTVVSDISIEVPEVLEEEQTLIEVVLGDGPLVIDQATKATEYANLAGDYASAEGDRAKNEANRAKAEADHIANTVTEMNDRLDNLLANTGDSTSEIVDMRLGADGEARATAGELIREVHSEVVRHNRETKPLKHGLQVINAKNSSPMKVEFYGNTLVNLLGSGGGLEGLNDDWKVINSNIKLTQGKYYLLVGENWINTRYFSLVNANNESLTSIPRDYLTSSNRTHVYDKILPSTDNIAKLRIRGDAQGTVPRISASLYEIDQATYDKIGVSLTDADVERMFPYVDSVQHVVNPVLTVKGENLLPPFSEWAVHANARVVSPYELELTAEYINNHTRCTVNVQSNEDYTLIFDGSTNGYFHVRELDENNVEINTHYSRRSGSVLKTSANTCYLQVEATNGVSGAGTYTFRNPMLTLGSEPKPFVPRNPSYLYAETTLAGNSDKQDKLYFNQGEGRWEKLKWWETDVVLDGSLGWIAEGNYTGYKRMRLPLTNASNSYLNTTIKKYDGSILKEPNNWSSADEYNQFNNLLYMTVSNTDSGFTDAMMPSNDMWKAYFNGWKYTGDGTDHSWVSLVDGSEPAENTLAYVSTNMAEGFTPYKLTYQLAEPVIEVEGIDFPYVEGDLSISGNAQVEVSSGVIVREKANPIQSGSDLRYYINLNLSGYADSILNHKAREIISVYKNGELTKVEILPHSSAYGSKIARIEPNDYDPDATYTVTYEILDKHAFTTNIQEVKATYAKGIRDALDDTVKKQSDIATDQSILKRQMLDVLVRLDAMESI